MRTSIVFVTLLLCGLASISVASENRFQQFNSDVGQAYAAYRVALFQTNKQDAEKSAQANENFLSQWQAIQDTYGAQAPEVFSSDTKWQSTLNAVQYIAMKSSTQIHDGMLTEAHETLEQIRDELSDLRRRNSIIVFSDHINNYHEVMEKLLGGDYTPDKINETSISNIRAQSAVLKYLADAIKKNSPETYRANPKYQQLEQELFASLAALEQAVAEKNQQAISKSINMLKPAYAKLFVNFG